MEVWATWREATTRALYGPDGFYRDGPGPAGHFRTSVHASPLFARALLDLLDRVDALLERPAGLDLVDVGAGRGELLTQVRDLAPDDLRPRLRLSAVEVAGRPPGLPADVAWVTEPPAGARGLVVANEWLDDVPLDVVEVTADGPRLLLVDPATGAERPGPRPSPEDASWLARWWPLEGAAPGARAEVGRPRDEAWAAAVRSLDRGLAVAVDYAHGRGARARGERAAGTLAGYRAGRRVAPVPDGSCDVTAHVALDACADAGVGAGATSTLLTSQHAALRALGVDGSRPPVPQAGTDARAYLAALSRAGEGAELTDPSGLGAFGWLVQGVGVPVPAVLDV